MRYRSYIIGRSDRCDLQIMKGTVSREHAELIIATNGRIMLSDRCSTHGTFLQCPDGWRKIEHEMVSRDARVRFAELEMTVAKLVDLAIDVGNGQVRGPAADQGREEVFKDFVIRRNPDDGSIVVQ